MLIYTDIKIKEMKEIIRKVLKEDNENMVEKLKQSFQTLLYIIEANKKGGFIEELKLENVFYHEKTKTIEGKISVKSYCEDPDVGVFTHSVDKVDTELYRIVRQYEFGLDGKLNKTPGEDTYLMFLFTKCEWDSQTSVLRMEYFIHQDEYSEWDV